METINILFINDEMVDADIQIVDKGDVSKRFDALLDTKDLCDEGVADIYLIDGELSAIIFENEDEWVEFHS